MSELSYVDNSQVASVQRSSNFIKDLEAQEQELEKLQAEIEAKKVRLASMKTEAIKQEINIKEAVSAIYDKLGDLVDEQYFVNFFAKPYITEQVGPSKLNVYVPKFVKNFQVGWLSREEESFYVYRLDQYSAWLGDIPPELQGAVNFSTDLQAYVENGHIHFAPAMKESVKKNLGAHVTDFTETDARVIQGHEWDLLVAMIDKNCLPYKPKPVAQEDRREPQSNIILRPWQIEPYNVFMATGASGFFLPTGAGKSFDVLKIFDEVKGKKLVIVDSVTLAEQWAYYIEAQVPHVKEEVRIATYQGFRYLGEEYTLTVFDECHHLPADTFSRLSTIKTKYRIGLSATPFREDKKEKYIYALTGKPVGLNWRLYMQQSKRTYHPVYLYVVKHQAQKIPKLNSLLDRAKKTFVYCDTIELGKQIGRAIGAPYIYGETKDRLDVIGNNKILVVSRVADAGVSVKDLQRIIEVDFLFGSRQQELQRTGRLMHSEADPKTMRHDIIMTEEEMRQYGKRLWSLQEKGFTVKVMETP